ncbi:heavy metal translocating P-type ATPase [Nocardia spumae]|uniref:heavy metal translocating P-type ATPase n=1 Tax=Nocardia spumae TaxID=2887190 RepID=UPI001D135392|nr:heavy metal translocating P-type ATPase [Nocardia spumae]
MNAPATTSFPAQRIRLAISGMSCAGCSARVERTLNKLDGVAATVNFATGVATIGAHTAISPDMLCDRIIDAGYGATPLLDTPTIDTAPEDRATRDLFQRLVVAVVLFVPLADLSVVFATVPGTRFGGWQLVLLTLALPIVVWSAAPLHRRAVSGLRTGVVGMETLVSLGITAATLWSMVTLAHRPAAHPVASGLAAAIFGADSIYLEVAGGVTVFVLAGRYFEAKARSRAGGALRALAALSTKDVTVLTAAGDEIVVPIAELGVGRRFVVRPGETIAADGRVVDGHSSVDAAAMTGESVPIEAGPGTEVTGGTVALTGRLIVEATAVGSRTRLAAMIRLVEDAQAEKAGLQRLADRIAGVFVPVVLALATLTSAGWLLGGADPDRAIGVAVAVLVIACPCALGLATPTALMVASGRGAQLGIFIKGQQALETSRDIDTVVFDKTGTLTTGVMTVATVHGGEDVVRLAGGMEAASEHAIGVAISAWARERHPALPAVSGFTALPGLGARGLVEGREVLVGRPALLAAEGIEIPEDLRRVVDTEQRLGRTAVVVGVDGHARGIVAVADAVRPGAAAAVERLHRLGLRTMLLTGDNACAARTVADEIGVAEVVAEVLPADKARVIRDLQRSGRRVAMVGDGINDGPALATADLGLAIGRGTDVAIGAADIILVRDDPAAIPDAITLARATLRTIRGNMVWAFGYNLAALPAAMAGLLNPLLAGAAMAFSSFFVVWNSLRLRDFRP